MWLYISFYFVVELEWGVRVSDLGSALKYITKCWVAMVFCEGLGLNEVIKNGKVGKSRSVQPL